MNIATIVTQAELETRVKQIIAAHLSLHASRTKELKEDDIKLTHQFSRDLDCDSLDIVELIMELEDQFGIEIPDEQADHIVTVQNVVDYIKSRAPNIQLES